MVPNLQKGILIPREFEHIGQSQPSGKLQSQSCDFNLLCGSIRLPVKALLGRFSVEFISLS